MVACSRIPMRKNQVAPCSKQENAALLQWMPFCPTLPEPRPMGTNARPKHLQTVQSAHAVQHPQGIIGVTLRVGKELNGIGVSSRELTQSLH